jgi:diaminohydroxyphosphoribosylaminopyrimidine deaminase/5-amino-6-(5-phosphoribosylamino)uracil reductase
MSNDHTLMLRAVELALRGQGAVEPNPMVGCVIARDDKVLGEGWHQRYGQAHAEVNALRACRDAGHHPAGATAYVTLEPCAHHGKTPPCADALIAANVSRVVVAIVDPHDKVDGKGIAMLRKAGVTVDIGEAADEAAAIVEPFVKRIRTGLPWVIAKWAQTLDGRIATATGDSKWITNEQSRDAVHQLRGRVDAVMVGIGTAIADDATLTARPRDKAGIKRVARRIVIDPTFRLPDASNLLTTLDAAPVTIAVSQHWHDHCDKHAKSRMHRWHDAGVEFVTLPTADGAEPHGDGRALSLRPLLSHLVRKHDATNVLVEGGATLLGRLFEQNMVDALHAYVAPKIVGDARAVPVLQGLECKSIADSRGLQLRDIQRFGDDVMLEYRVAAASS